jgi:hypothetical protein
MFRRFASVGGLVHTAAVSQFKMNLFGVRSSHKDERMELRVSKSWTIPTRFFL